MWCGGDCVAASAGNLHLDRPIFVGELVDVRAGLVYTGRSSMHIVVTVHSTDPTGARAAQATQCPMVFVAVNPTCHPVEVPPWTPVTMLELQRHRQARVRMKMRKRIEGAMPAERYDAEGTEGRTALCFRADRSDTNRGGMVRAGRVMRWIDETAYVCGADWTGVDVVTSYIAGIRFYRAILVGDVIEVTARIVHTGPRSIHIGVKVSTTDSELAAGGMLVTVSLDERGDARSVPTWEPSSIEDDRLDQHARQLIELRQFVEPFTSATALPVFVAWPTVEG
jgi:4-hydroxybenzoyl-CoA thioesterase